MAARSKYFYEDSVCISHGGNVHFGIVTENDEYISSDDEDFASHKSCEFRPLQKGEVRVSWHPSGREVVMPQKMVCTCNYIILVTSDILDTMMNYQVFLIVIL